MEDNPSSMEDENTYTNLTEMLAGWRKEDTARAKELTQSVLEETNTAKQARSVLDDTDELLTVSEVARLLRVDPTTVRRWITRKSLEAIELPHHGYRKEYRIKKSVLQKLLKEFGI